MNSSCCPSANGEVMSDYRLRNLVVTKNLKACCTILENVAALTLDALTNVTTTLGVDNLTVNTLRMCENSPAGTLLLTNDQSEMTCFEPDNVPVGSVLQVNNGTVSWVEPSYPKSTFRLWADYEFTTPQVIENISVVVFPQEQTISPSTSTDYQYNPLTGSITFTNPGTYYITSNISVTVESGGSNEVRTFYMINGGESTTSYNELTITGPEPDPSNYKFVNFNNTTTLTFTTQSNVVQLMLQVLLGPDNPASIYSATMSIVRLV